MEQRRFRDRAEAGRLLAERLRRYSGRDDVVVLALLPGKTELVVVPGATHLFEEPGALETVARLAADWFGHHFGEDDGAR